MRKLWVASLALTVGAAMAAGPASALASAGPVPQAHVVLPAPSGRYGVGTVSLELTDHSRANPWTASPRYRELMVSIWYPAADTRCYPRAPQMLPGAAAHFGSANGAAKTLYNIPAGSVDWAATLTSGHELAPVARHRAPFPVVLYSPGAGDPRTWETTLVQNLASRGYVVVTIDHPYDASEVEFPNGKVVDSQLEKWIVQAERTHTVQALVKKIFAVRVADVRYVVGALTALDAGREPDAGHQPLPRGLAGSLNLRKIGMFGVSAGGITAAQAMYEDPRIIAGIDVDGSIESPLVSNPWTIVPVFRHGLHQPFMFMGDPQANHYTIPTWKSFWVHTSGWHLDLTLKGASGESSYKDAVPLIPQIARQLGLPRSFVTKDIGTIDPAQATTAEEAYVSAFFDRWLRGQDNHLLDRPSPRYPQITFVR
ncbi:MAG TPA: lipase [Streptosporangiaceae bacterium]|nr:lipase [Streptosporangiaceae bacterium]